MAGLVGGTSGNSKSTPRYSQMNIQTSTQGLVIPIHYGRNRVAPNIIYYGGFRSVAAKSQGGKGGGGGKGASSYNYFADVLLALAEGVVTEVFQVFKGQSAQLLSQDNMVLFEGTQTQAPWSYLESVNPSAALAYAGTAYIGCPQLALGTSPDLPDYSFEIAGPLYGSVPSAQDCNPADIMHDYITNQYYGLAPGSDFLDAASLQQYRLYCYGQNILFSPYFSQQEQVTNTFQRWAQLTNSFIFWSGNVLKFVPLGPYELSGYGYTYTPQITPIYNLTYEDLLAEAKGKEPVTVQRTDPADGYNQIQLDIRDRSNAYNNTSVYWSDPASVNQYGQLMANIIQADEICLQSTADTAAQLLGLRSVYVRNTYQFKLGYGFVLLEPGDIITITEPNIGLSNFPVRVTSVEEGEDQILTVTCEEFPASIGQTVAQEREPAGAASTYDPFVQPGNVNPPAIFEPPVVATGGQAEVWVGLSGGENWGGAAIYLSFDGESYSQIGLYYTPIVQGRLANYLAEAADPDTTNTLYVDLSMSDSTLPSTATTADATALRTLFLVDREVMAYGTVALGGTSESFDLTYLRRGQYGTQATPHWYGTTGTIAFDAPSGSTVLTLTSAADAVPGQFLGPNSGTLAIPGGASILGVSGNTLTIDQQTEADMPGGTTFAIEASVFSRIDPTSVFTYNLPAAYVGQKLYFKFPSFNVFGNSAQSLADATEYVYTPVGVAYSVAAPTGLTAAGIASGASLSWTPAPGSNTLYYQVHYNTVDDFATSTIFSSNATSTGQIITGLTPGTEYWFWVTANSAAAVSSPSASATATPTAGGGVVATVGTSSSSYGTLTGGGATTLSGTPGGPLTVSTVLEGLSGTVSLGGFIAIDSPGATIAAGGTLVLPPGGGLETLSLSGGLTGSLSGGGETLSLTGTALEIVSGTLTLAGITELVVGTNISVLGTSGSSTATISGTGGGTTTGTLGVEYEGTIYQSIAAASNITIAPGTGSLSGTLLLSATGGGGGGGSTVFENNGTSVGSASTINLSPGFYATISGDVATLILGSPASGAYLYWRFYCTRNSGAPGGNIAFSEIQFDTGTGAFTVPTGGAASASSDYSTSVNEAFDGNFSTFWASSGANVNDWIQYEFSAPIGFSRIQFSPRDDAYADQGPVSIVIQVSNDGTTFTNLLTFTPSTWYAGVNQIATL